MNDLFLTGASGFLGSRLLARLDPSAYTSITLLCRSEPVLPESLRSAANVRVVRASLDDVDDYAGFLGTGSLVVHMAAVTGKANRAAYLAVNTHATGKLIDAAAKAGVAGFLFISSIAVSFRNRQGYHYADSKEQAEQLLKNSTLPWCTLRPTIILGEKSPIWHSFRALAGKSLIVLPGNGRTQIQPIDVDDLTRLMLDIIGERRFNNEVLEIGGPEALSLDTFVQRIHQACCGGRPRIVHLPLGLVVTPLRLVERVFPSLLPVSSGQFASFCNDGTVTANALLTPADGEMRDVSEMLQRLTGSEAHV
jgi:NADH dehydrogenase